jgi:hypothetical protein
MILPTSVADGQVLALLKIGRRNTCSGWRTRFGHTPLHRSFHPKSFLHLVLPQFTDLKMPSFDGELMASFSYAHPCPKSIVTCENRDFAP